MFEKLFDHKDSWLWHLRFGNLNFRPLNQLITQDMVTGSPSLEMSGKKLWYATVTKNVVARFIRHNLICRYGVPERIITDNGTNLNNKMITELCKQFKIQHHNSSPYRPKMNGAVEAANKTLRRLCRRWQWPTKTGTRCYHSLFMGTVPQHGRQ